MFNCCFPIKVSDRRPLLIFSLLVIAIGTFAQEPGTIRVKKESDLVKAVFDNTDLKLIVVDRFGNPRDNRIAAFKLYVKTKKETREFQGFNNKLTSEMVSYLNKQSRSAKIFFTEINAIDDDEHLTKLPDVIDTWFPDCPNCVGGRKRNVK